MTLDDFRTAIANELGLRAPTGGVAAGALVELTINNRNGLPTSVADSVGGNTWTLVDSNTSQSN